MSKVTKRWLSEDLQLQLTGMVSDIIDLEASTTGLGNAVAGLTGAVSSIRTDIAGLTGTVNNHNTYILGMTGAIRNLEMSLTGAVNSLETDITNIENNIAGLTGAVSYLNACCTGANNYLAGLTGSVSNLATYIYNIQAVNVGFSPITGAGSTNVQGAIAALVQYINAAVTGVNYGSGVTGAMGFTGAMGVTGYGGVIAHNQLTNMPDISGIVTDHDVRLVPKVQNDAPAIPTPFTGMLWLDMDAVESMGVTGPGGLPGFTGLQGVTGLEGPITGLQGPRGTTGLQGPRGLQGIQGLTGAEGSITGLPGPMGATGLDGVTGLNGLDGVTGSQGATGVNPQETSNIAFDTLTISANTITLDLSTNSTFSVTLTSNVTTVNITNITSGKLNFFTLFVSQDGAGGKTFATPVNWSYPGGSAYVVSSTASAKDLVQGMSFDNGTTWLITYAKAFA